MNLLPFLNKNGMWFSPLLFFLGMFLLWFFIATVTRLGGKNRLCSVPLIAMQDVEFAEVGRVVLWAEGPLLSGRLAGLSYALIGLEGSAVEGRANWFPLKSSSFSRVRLVERIFTIPRPGRYVLHVRGLGAPQAADEKYQLIFMRPYLLQTVGCVLGIIFGAFVTIGSILYFMYSRFGGGRT